MTDYYAGAGFFTQVLAPKHNALLVFAGTVHSPPHTHTHTHTRALNTAHI